MSTASMQFHVLSFEGLDPYARAGGLATRVDGLTGALAALGFETHLWFVGDPGLPGTKARGPPARMGPMGESMAPGWGLRRREANRPTSRGRFLRTW